jgi:hypothetical protein
MHTSFGSHSAPQAPQFVLSVPVSVHTKPEGAVADGHMVWNTSHDAELHTPALHV